ncbi:hypothetical protein GCM10027416_19570 [Okibacterium endophyticum]
MERLEKTAQAGPGLATTSVLPRILSIHDNDEPLDPEQYRIAVEGISAIAITNFEMGAGEAQARTAVLALWEQLGRPRGAFAEAATSTTHSPQPVLQTAEETERARQIREMLGVRSSEEALVAMLSACEMLEQLAAELDG